MTPPAACEVGTEQKSEALGNICGQLQGEAPRSEGKKLAFNKQDNGCHTLLLTPPLTATSLSLPSFLFD